MSSPEPSPEPVSEPNTEPESKPQKRVTDEEREFAMVKYARRVQLVSQLTRVSQALRVEKRPSAIKSLLEEQKRIKGMLDYLNKHNL